MSLIEDRVKGTGYLKIAGRRYSLLAGLLGMMACPMETGASITVCNIDHCRLKVAGTGSGTYTQTRYPLVMVHGMGGGTDDASDNTRYAFYGIPEDLSRNGTQVYLPKVSAYNTTEIRGEQLRKQLKIIQAVTGQPKFNLLGHSHGAPTVRYILGVSPEMVASVTSVGGPHQGSIIADKTEGIVGMIRYGLPLMQVFGIVSGSLVNLAPSLPRLYPEDPAAGMKALSLAGAAEFNRRFPVGMPATQCGEGNAVSNGIPLFSWSGTGVITNWRDVTDYILTPFYLSFGEANDGLVTRCSSHFGKVLRDNYNMNHFDEINQTKGLVASGLNVPSIYRTHLNRLKNLGL